MKHVNETQTYNTYFCLCWGGGSVRMTSGCRQQNIIVCVYVVVCFSIESIFLEFQSRFFLSCVVCSFSYMLNLSCLDWIYLFSHVLGMGGASWYPNLLQNAPHGAQHGPKLTLWYPYGTIRVQKEPPWCPKGARKAPIVAKRDPNWP